MNGCLRFVAYRFLLFGLVSIRDATMNPLLGGFIAPVQNELYCRS